MKTVVSRRRFSELTDEKAFTMWSNRIIATTVSALAMVAMSAFAADLGQVEKSIPLKDGSTVYVLKGGKRPIPEFKAVWTVLHGPDARPHPTTIPNTSSSGTAVTLIRSER